MSYLQYEPPSRCLAPGSFRTPLPCARRRRPSPVGSLIWIWWWQCQRCTTDFLLWSLDWNHKQISLDRGTQQERYQASVLSDLSKSCCTNSSMRFYSWIAVALEYLSFLYLTYLKFGWNSVVISPSRKWQSYQVHALALSQRIQQNLMSSDKSDIFGVRGPILYTEKTTQLMTMLIAKK